jgi:peptide-methionine (S)-S-oxide reductase
MNGENFSISRGDQTEAIQIEYDPTQISYLELLNLFWNNHIYGLTNKIKTQVRNNLLTRIFH